jgi:hypothetical protein
LRHNASTSRLASERCSSTTARSFFKKLTTQTPPVSGYGVGHSWHCRCVACDNYTRLGGDFLRSAAYV